MSDKYLVDNYIKLIIEPALSKNLLSGLLSLKGISKIINIISVSYRVSYKENERNYFDKYDYFSHNDWWLLKTCLNS